MKTFLKFLLILLLVVVLAAAGFLGYMYFWKPTKVQDAFQVIPKDAVFVIETSNLSEGWKAVAESKIWENLKKTEYFKGIDTDMAEISDYLRNNKIVGSLLRDRELLVSAHMISVSDYDFLIVADMKKSSNLISSLKKAIGLLPNFTMNENYNTVGEYSLTEINSLKDNMKFYASIVDNLLIISFSPSLLEKSLQQKADKHWEKDKSFKEVISGLNTKNLFRFYFNYNLLEQFSGVYLTGENDIIKLMGNALNYTALNVNLQNEQLSFSGFTSLDSLPSYIRAAADIAPSKMSAYNVIPDDAAFYMSICFNSFSDFFNKLKSQYASENSEDYEDYSKNINRLTDFLKIDLEENLNKWIGNEIATVKLRPSFGTKMEDIVVAINATSAENATEGLDEIALRIRKRTPMKFDEIKYKGCSIKYLNLKGFFKLFLGRLWDKLEIPYYAVLGDYVVFSNSEIALKQVIDNYLTGNTLAKNKAFSNFIGEFESNTNVGLFIQTPKIYENLYFFSKPNQREKIKENKEIILSFNLLGMQLTSKKKNLLSTTLVASHDTSASFKEELLDFEKTAILQLFTSEFDSLSFKIKLPEKELQKNGAYKLNYPDTTAVQAEGTIQNKKINDMWRTYYKNGNISSEVNYVNGKVDGDAFFYYNDKAHNLRATMTFDEDVLNGKYTEYYDNSGKTVKAELNYEDGKLDGVATFYHPNGKRKIEGKYKKGNKSGTWFYYNEKGEQIEHSKFRKGKLKRGQDLTQNIETETFDADSAKNQNK